MARRIVIVALLVATLVIPYHRAFATDDTAFTTTRLSRVASVVVEIGNSIGFDIFGFIIPIFNKEKQIAAPDHEPTAIWKEAFNEYFTPQNHKEDGKHIDWAPDQLEYSALYGAILKTDAEHSNHPPPTDCIISTGPEISSPIPFAELDFQKAREADAWLGINPVDPDETGVIDYNLPPKIITGMDGAEDCKKMDPGVELTKVENNARRLSQFGEGAIITQDQAHEIDMIWITIWKLIKGVWTEVSKLLEEPNPQGVILTMKKRLPYYHIMCHDGGCPPNEAGEYSGNAAESGGYAAFTLREEDKKPLEDASLQPYEIMVAGFPQKPLLASYDIRNQSETRQKQAACYMVPDTTGASYGDVQAVTAIGGKLNINSECKPKLALCPIDLVEQGQAKSSGSCNLSNTGSYTSSDAYLTEQEKAALPNGIPPLMKKVLEAAGATYNVPASVLLGTMLEEGSFSHADVWSWSDETVRQFSDCTIKDPMPSCEAFAHPTTGAKGPFGFIQNWWDQYIESGGPYKAYEGDATWQEVLTEIPEGNITQCNFVDAAFTAARELGEDQSHLYVSGIPTVCPLQSGTINVYQGTDIPGSCSAWSAERTALARLQYGDRVCDLSVERMVNTYRNFSAGGGNESF
jgi:hypothetical protein